MNKSSDKNLILSSSRDMEKLHQLMESMNFSSLEEMQSFMNKEVTGHRIDDVLAKFKVKDENSKVTELLDKALESEPDKAVKLLEKVLKMDDENPEALLFLSEIEEDAEKELSLIKRSIESARKRLGEEYFEENRGRFWYMAKTRTYMKAMHALGDYYLNENKLNEAAKIFSEMIELNPGDNQGIRDVYAPLLVLQKKYDEYRKLRKIYPEEYSALWYYLYSIYLYRTAGPVAKFYQSLREAYKINPHFVHITIGIEKMPKEAAEYYSPGDINEAYLAMGKLLNLIEDTSGYLPEFDSLPGLKQKIKEFEIKKKDIASKTILPIPKYFCEYVAFFFLATETIKDGVAYMFFAVDAFNGQAFFLSAEQNMNDAMLLRKIKELMTHSDFITQSRPFSLVLDEFEELKEEIDKIIAPYNGKVIFNEVFADKIADPFRESMMEFITKQK